MSTAVLTYTSLLTDVRSYLERPNDAGLDVQLPRLVMMAENRIATDLRILGTQQVLTSQFELGNARIPKPSRWRRTVSFRYTSATGATNELSLRTYEVCRSFWPTESVQTSTPRYYADYNFKYFFIAGTPGAALNFELVFIQKLEPLSVENQVNWYTDEAPQLMIAATLLECEIWLKNQTRIPGRQASYDSSLNAFRGEDASRVADRNIVVGQ
jgi:hypothetical protein